MDPLRVLYPQQSVYNGSDCVNIHFQLANEVRQYIMRIYILTKYMLSPAEYSVSLSLVFSLKFSTALF